MAVLNSLQKDFVTIDDEFTLDKMFTVYIKKYIYREHSTNKKDMTKKR